MMRPRRGNPLLGVGSVVERLLHTRTMERLGHEAAFMCLWAVAGGALALALGARPGGSAQIDYQPFEEADPDLFGPDHRGIKVTLVLGQSSHEVLLVLMCSCRSWQSDEPGQSRQWPLPSACQ